MTAAGLVVLLLFPFMIAAFVITWRARDRFGPYASVRLPVLALMILGTIYVGVRLVVAG